MHHPLFPEAWAQKAETIIGNGPFKISEIVSKDHVTLVPNPGYWIFAGTLFMLGTETVFLSFLVGILDLSREGRRCG